jgi:hypothetical protein
MPYAAQLCGDIARHPLPMLSPGRARSVCAGMVNGPLVFVSSNWHHRRTAFDGEPGCGWPGGTGLAIYWAAASQNRHLLGQSEPRLRCDDDRTLLATATPWRSVFACTHGLWTPRTKTLIATAERVEPISALMPETIFPTEIGVRRCTFGAGGLGRHELSGKCGVNVTRVWHNPQVTFTESWGTRRQVGRHTWVVTVAGGQPRLTRQSGPVAPQFWI